MSKVFTKIVDVLDDYQNAIVHLIVAIILIGGVGYTLYLGNALRYPDERAYFKIAQNMALGNGMSLHGTTPTALLPPVMITIMASFMKLGAPIVVLRYLNFIALAIGVYVIRSILRTSGLKAGAPLAAILILAYPVLFYTAGTLYTQTLFTFILLLLIRVTVSPRFSYLHAVVLGILSTLLILTHSTGVFIPPVLVLWLILPKNYSMIGKGVVAALIAILCISPWWYRNYKIFDCFIPATTHGGDTLYIGNHSETNLSKWYDYAGKECYVEAHKLPEQEMNAFFLNKVIEFWTQQPGEALKLYGIKLAYHFHFRNNLHTSGESSRLRDTVMFITYYSLLLCLLIRLLFAFRLPLTRLEKLLVTIYIVSAFFHAVFLPRLRFRLPYDTVLITHIGVMFALLKDQLFLQKQPVKMPGLKDELKQFD